MRTGITRTASLTLGEPRLGYDGAVRQDRSEAACRELVLFRHQEAQW